MKLSWILLLGFALFSSSSAKEVQGIPLPENTSIVCALIGEGVQIYQAKSNPAGGYQWILKAPEAELKTLAGKSVGKHFAGPSWSADDGSEIVGALPPLKTLNSPDSRNIPFLLIGVKSRSGFGLLEGVDYVVRMSTVGGAPPSSPPKAEDETVRVEYRAIYLFLQKS
jgi:hypothetical protein